MLRRGTTALVAGSHAATGSARSRVIATARFQSAAAQRAQELAGSSDQDRTVYDDVVAKRRRYLSPSLATFEAYDDPFLPAKGSMQYMWDIQGRKYIDLLGQNLCISVGHAHPTVVEAAVDQMRRLPHCTTMYYHEQPAELGKALAEKMPPHPSGEDWVVHLVNDGSEAVDLAAQMARVYTGHTELVGLHKAYHGLHGYAAALTAIGKTQQQPQTGGFSHVPANNLEHLKNHLTYLTAGKVAGMIVEPLQGYGGIFPLNDGYMREAFALVRDAGGVAIADEVQTGFNRCGETFWGFEMKHNDCVPDIVTVAKGMGNGVGILGAVICRRDIAEAFCDKMFFNTYVLQVMESEGTLDNCRAMGELFRQRLGELCERLPHVLKEVRGTGLFQGLEIGGASVQASQGHAIEMHKRLREYGVVLGRGSAAGNVFRVQPPMCISADDVHHVCNSIEEVAKEYIAEKRL